MSFVDLKDQFGQPRYLTFHYTNYKGEIDSSRIVRAVEIEFKDSRWHPEPQWLMLAWDIRKHAFREFAMRDMRTVRGTSISVHEAIEIEREIANARS